MNWLAIPAVIQFGNMSNVENSLWSLASFVISQAELILRWITYRYTFFHYMRFWLRHSSWKSQKKCRIFNSICEKKVNKRSNREPNRQISNSSRFDPRIPAGKMAVIGKSSTNFCYLWYHFESIHFICKHTNTQAQLGEKKEWTEIKTSEGNDEQTGEKQKWIAIKHAANMRITEQSYVFCGA